MKALLLKDFYLMKKNTQSNGSDYYSFRFYRVAR